MYVLTISHLLDIVDNVMMNVMCYVQPTVPTIPTDLPPCGPADTQPMTDPYELSQSAYHLPSPS